MRSTTRLTALITFVSMLAMLLMLFGCIASFLWLNKQRIEHQFNTLATSVDQALFKRTPQEMTRWLQGVMPVVNIERLELYDGKHAVIRLARHEFPLVEDTPNRFYHFSSTLMHHPSLTLRITILNPVQTWLASFAGISTFIVMGIVVLVMSVLLLLLHFWLDRESSGMGRLEARSQRILQGDRTQAVTPETTEWPPKVSQAIDTLLQEIEQAGVQRVRIDTLIREFASLDSESGLNNRLFFNSRFATLLDSQEEAAEHGCIIMLRFTGSDGLPETSETERQNQRLFEFVHSMSALISCYPGALLARYFQNDFTVLLPHRSLKEAEGIAAKLITAAEASAPLGVYNKDDFVHIAISDWQRGQSMTQVMERLDLAMRRATLLGSNNWAIEESHPLQQGRGSVRWRTLLENTYQRGGPLLLQKAVTDWQGQIHHRVLQGRIKDNDQSILPAEYMPLVCDIGMAALWDRQFLTRGFLLAAESGPGVWSFPLTIDALLQRPFAQWLYKMLLQIPLSKRKRFLFELAEADVCQHIDRLFTVLHNLRAFGCQIVISQAGQTLVSSAYLPRIKAAAIKLDAGLVRNIERRPENQLLVSSLVESCHAVSTLVFATGVRTREEWMMLINLGVSGGQGDFIAPPLPVKFMRKDAGKKRPQEMQ